MRLHPDFEREVLRVMGGPEPPRGSAYVYVISVLKDGHPSAPIKIGSSSDPEKRLRGLQTACPFPLMLVNERLCRDRATARAIETAFHDACAMEQLCGEWFDIDPDHASKMLFQIERTDGLDS